MKDRSGTVKVMIGSRVRFINPETHHPQSHVWLRAFIKAAEGRDCFSKFKGKVWMLTKEGNWKEVCRNFSNLSYNDYLELSNKF